MSEYKVKFEVFEGPLDLLLYLVKKQEVSIYEVNLTTLATEFIQYVDFMRELDLEIAGEFLVMAATLMYIKSKELLPVEKQVTVEDEEDEEDPRWELIRQLVEYKKFKDAATNLQSLETLQEHIYPRVPGKIDIQPSPQTLVGEASVFALINAVNNILKRVDQRGNPQEIFEDKWSVSEKLETITTMLLEKERVAFSSLFSEAGTRTEVVVTFLALLELTRLHQVIILQSEHFGEIDVCRNPNPHESLVTNEDRDEDLNGPDNTEAAAEPPDENVSETI